MTSDDLDTWQVGYDVFIGADFESGIHFALNDDTEAHDIKQVKIVMTEKSQENGPSCSTLRDLDPHITLHRCNLVM